jgi:hypothetical protein
MSLTPTLNLLLLLPFVLGPMACFPSELVWNYGSYRQFVAFFERVISPVARPLPTRGNTNTEETRTQPTILMFDQPKTFHSLDRAATVTTFHLSLFICGSFNNDFGN